MKLYGRVSTKMADNIFVTQGAFYLALIGVAVSWGLIGIDFNFVTGNGILWFNISKWIAIIVGGLLAVAITKATLKYSFLVVFIMQCKKYQNPFHKSMTVMIQII